MNEEYREEKDDKMPAEYEVKAGVRGKYFKPGRTHFTAYVTMRDGTVEERLIPLVSGIVVIDTDLRDQFPDSESVNKALRSMTA